MRAKIEIRDTDTDEVLETVGTLLYENTAQAIQNCERWYEREIHNWERDGHQCEIVLVDIGDNW